MANYSLHDLFLSQHEIKIDFLNVIVHDLSVHIIPKKSKVVSYNLKCNKRKVL